MNTKQIKEHEELGYKCGLNIPETFAAPGTHSCSKKLVWWYENNSGHTLSGHPAHIEVFLCDDHARTVNLA
jgi:hypothetical protein